MIGGSQAGWSVVDQDRPLQACGKAPPAIILPPFSREHKPMKANQKPVVHVVFGMSAAASLRQAVARLGLEQPVVGLPDDLSLGPIDPPANDLRVKWMEDILGYDGFDAHWKHADLFRDRATDSGIIPIVWVCRRCAEEYCGFLEFLWRIGDQPFRVVDITDIELRRSPGRPGSQTWITPTFGFVTAGAMIDARLIDRRTTLSVRQLADYRETWAKLRAENAAFRIVTEQGLSSAPIPHFDNVIVSCVTEEWQTCARVVGSAIDKLSDGNFDQCGDLVLWSRVKTLANEGVFENRGDGDQIGESFVRRPA